MSSTRVAITGMGVVSSLGWTCAETWDAIEREESGFRPLTCFDSVIGKGVLVGQVDGDPAERSGLATGSRTDHLAMCAARQAFEDGGLDRLSEEALNETGVVLGVTTGGMSTTEVYLQGLLKEGRADFDLMRHHECATPCRTVANHLGVHGIQTTVSTACAAAANALGTARDLILAGETNRILAGGVDALTRLTFNGFSSLMIHDSTGCKPFDVERSGMTLGEGAAVLVLESEDTARARGARIHAWLTGVGCSCDAYHPTAPTPDGSGVLRAMERALDDAKRTPSDVDYLNAHGTGTRENDAAEAKAIASLFGKSPPPVSSTKGFSGHTLAAAGAIEAIICILSMERRCIPCNLGLKTVDPSIAFAPITSTRREEVNVAMSNSLGFGGNNCVLVLEKSE